jgi:hypothetical protein
LFAQGAREIKTHPRYTPKGASKLSWRAPRISDMNLKELSIRRIEPLSIAIICLAALAAPSHAQDANKIIDQYQKAAGGSKALSKILTLTIEGTFTSADGAKSGSYTFDIKSPNRYYSELNVESGVALDGAQPKLEAHHLIEAYNGKSAWHQDASGGVSSLLGQDSLQMEDAALYYNLHFNNLKKNKIGFALIGHAQVQGRDTLQIELTSPAGMKREIFFDAQTHLIAKESAVIAGINQEMIYGDYRAVDDVKVPFKIELHRGNDVFQITVTRAVLNPVVSERVFDFPRKSQVQLPDLKALFKQIDDNQKAIDKILENYAGTRNEEETEYDNAGQVKKKEVKEYSFFYMYGDEISTLVKKDGKPLSDDEQKKENEKAQKEIVEVQKNHDKKDAKEAKAEEQGKKNDDDPDIETFLRACQFVNPRRERFRGQDVLVFDFEPNPEFKPHKMGEDIVHKLAGVIWIDEKALDVVRLEAYFVGDFKIAGGVLANLQKGTSFIFEQAFTNNEVWLPTYLEAHVGVRLLLVKGLKVNMVTRYSDYKKFNVETLHTVGPPKQD